MKDILLTARTKGKRGAKVNVVEAVAKAGGRAAYAPLARPQVPRAMMYSSTTTEGAEVAAPRAAGIRPADAVAEVTAAKLADADKALAAINTDARILNTTQHVIGSTAGASSAGFDVYRKTRNLERNRLERLEHLDRELEAQAEYARKVAETQARLDAEAAKKKRKREAKKQRQRERKRQKKLENMRFEPTAPDDDDSFSVATVVCPSPDPSSSSSESMSGSFGSAASDRIASGSEAELPAWSASQVSASGSDESEYGSFCSANTTCALHGVHGLHGPRAPDEPASWSTEQASNSASTGPVGDEANPLFAADWQQPGFVPRSALVASPMPPVSSHPALEGSFNVYRPVINIDLQLAEDHTSGRANGPGGAGGADAYLDDDDFSSDSSNSEHGQQLRAASSAKAADDNSDSSDDDEALNLISISHAQFAHASDLVVNSLRGPPDLRRSLRSLTKMPEPHLREPITYLSGLGELQLEASRLPAQALAEELLAKHMTAFLPPDRKYVALLATRHLMSAALGDADFVRESLCSEPFIAFVRRTGPSKKPLLDVIEDMVHECKELRVRSVLRDIKTNSPPMHKAIGMLWAVNTPGVHWRTAWDLSQRLARLLDLDSPHHLARPDVQAAVMAYVESGDREAMAAAAAAATAAAEAEAARQTLAANMLADSQRRALDALSINLGRLASHGSGVWMALRDALVSCLRLFPELRLKALDKLIKTAVSEYSVVDVDLLSLVQHPFADDALGALGKRLAPTLPRYAAQAALTLVVVRRAEVFDKLRAIVAEPFASTTMQSLALDWTFWLVEYPGTKRVLRAETQLEELLGMEFVGTDNNGSGQGGAKVHTPSTASETSWDGDEVLTARFELAASSITNWVLEQALHHAQAVALGTWVGITRTKCRICRLQVCYVSKVEVPRGSADRSRRLRCASFECSAGGGAPGLPPVCEHPAKQRVVTRQRLPATRVYQPPTWLYTLGCAGCGTRLRKATYIAGSGTNGDVVVVDSLIDNGRTAQDRIQGGSSVLLLSKSDLKEWLGGCTRFVSAVPAPEPLP
ncbi:uncharacterized protein AMSG_11897 [Thecamonas trahens ATCC 50062]|uniref:Uncharacterized protein n=1 Tax=Thecamonas trahens ATCC 50062 TaxID=461836 RepID=A0A0L0DC28_THETB|nr:hypothetical protein AMSG_11897 [Thecamonas trahens ATCC 50062]KNC49631.1 hypothetical protein AMSG_11897 [Thecamonas trahens ATCC 50062]|eukprot:XP_013757771.1 hypothetical protein AMSG_11897 [Thecamonas trahens ATCC 50062]